MKFFVFILFIQCTTGLPDGLHPTPPMGWTSWNTFFENNSEQKMLSQADALLKLELDKFGYRFLTIDDYWQLPSRDSETGRMVADPEKFPNGIRFISDYFHDRGLNIGIYSSAGRYTCSGYLPGSLSHEKTDVEMLLDFDIDYFKYDNCYPDLNGTTNMGAFNIDYEASRAHFPSIHQSPSEESRYAPMAAEIASVKHLKNITLELCAWGNGNVETFGSRFAHLWRSTVDVRDTWESMLLNIDMNDEPRFRGEGVQGPNHGWNYPDGLFIGKGGMTDTEYMTMFALWCIVKSPLMLGNDLTTMTKESLAYKIITNPHLLAINQDPLGVQGSCVKDCCSHNDLGGGLGQISCAFHYHSWQVWTGPLAGGDIAVVVVNRFDYAIQIDMDWQKDAKIPPGPYTLQNAWSGEEEGPVVAGEETYSGTLDAHANWAFRLTPLL